MEPLISAVSRDTAVPSQLSPPADWERECGYNMSVRDVGYAATLLAGIPGLVNSPGLCLAWTSLGTAELLRGALPWTCPAGPVRHTGKTGTETTSLGSSRQRAGMGHDDQCWTKSISVDCVREYKDEIKGLNLCLLFV